MSVIAVFPRRSLQLSNSGERTPTSWWVVGVLLFPAALFLLWLFLSQAQSLLDDYRLHKSGTVAKASQVSNVDIYNSRSSDFVSFDLRYVTEDGTSHNTHVKFASSWIIDRIHLPLVVRYDPASPKHISTSYGVEYLVGRTIHVVLMASLPVAWICFWVLASFSSASDDRQSRLKLRSIGAQPTPVEANLTRMETGKDSVKMFYSWTDSFGHALNGSFTMNPSEQPFWLDTARTKLLALSGPNGESVLLDADLAWADLTWRERARVIEVRREELDLSAESAADLAKPIGIATAEAPAPAIEAAKKKVKDSYLDPVSGRMAADAATASASVNKGFKVLCRFLLVSGLLAIVVGVWAGVTHDRKAREPVTVTFEPFNLADGIAPRSTHVELTGLADPTMAIEVLDSGSRSEKPYIPLLPPGWRQGDPVVYFLESPSYALQHSQPHLIRAKGVLIRDGLPSDIASQSKKRGIKLGTPPIVLNTDPEADLDGYYVTVIVCGIWALTALISFAKFRGAARSMPNDRGRIS